MRAYLTFFLVSVMTLLLVFFLVTRTRVPHDAPAEVTEPVAVADAGDAGWWQRRASVRARPGGGASVDTGRCMGCCADQADDPGIGDRGGH